MNKRTYEEIVSISNFNLKEINCMKHALGIDRLSIKNGKCICHRNHFICGNNEDDVWLWNGLVFVGFAELYAKGTYKVTKDGIRFLEDILSAKIEMY